MRRGAVRLMAVFPPLPAATPRPFAHFRARAQTIGHLPCADVLISAGMVRVFQAGLATAVLLLFGCGASSVKPTDGGDSFVTCDTDPRAVPYAPGLSVRSGQDLFTVRLLSSTPGPPVKGKNRWLVQIEETGTAMPLDGLDVTVAPFMPDHQHDTLAVVVTPGEAGTYTFDPVYLFMSGFWEVRMDIRGESAGQGISDRAVLPACIP